MLNTLPKGNYPRQLATQMAFFDTVQKHITIPSEEILHTV
uniref:Uncharacterized protein n=1 Tax=Arundo donax TaxID=35708 RepID=A0A0A9APA8_ARUDO